MVDRSAFAPSTGSGLWWTGGEDAVAFAIVMAAREDKKMRS